MPQFFVDMPDRDRTHGEFLYNNAFYYALGKGDGNPDAFAAAYVKYVREYEGDFNWQGVNEYYYSTWKVAV